MVRIIHVNYSDYNCELADGIVFEQDHTFPKEEIVQGKKKRKKREKAIEEQKPFMLGTKLNGDKKNNG